MCGPAKPGCLDITGFPPAKIQSRLGPRSRIARAGCCLVALFLFFLYGCSQAIVSVPGETFDAGPVFAADQAELSHRFQITNTTGRRVRILGERHSCTCTTTDLPRAVLGPGESTFLTMTVSIPHSYAQREVGCTVLTDDPQYPEWNYGIRFESLPGARIEPEQISVGTLAPWKESKGEDRAIAEAWLEVFAPPGASLPEPSGPLDVVDGLVIHRDQRPVIDNLARGALATGSASRSMEGGCRPGSSPAASTSRSLVDHRFRRPFLARSWPRLPASPRRSISAWSPPAIRR